MADVLIRNIPEDVMERLKQRAGRNNRSLQQELLRLVTQAAGDEVDELVSVIRERRAEYETAGRRFGNSVDLVRRDRGR
ncbi:MAG: Arc family DNA-binding protein [Gaiellales bacterium]|nr:MAG: Arc family DNA-binding protein [Gaiellales bacterium]